MYANIALMSPPYSTLTYMLPEWLPKNTWKPGLRVAVLLNNKILRSGILLSLTQECSNLPTNIKIKPILWPLEKKVLFSKEYLSMVQQLALKQAIQPGKILAHVLPTGLKTTQIQLRLFNEKNNPTYIPLNVLKDKMVDELKSLGLLWKNNKADCLAYKEDSALSELCVLNKNPPWSLRPTASLQRSLLEFLFKYGVTSKRILLKKFGGNVKKTLQTLVESEFITLVSEYIEKKELNTTLVAATKPSHIFSSEQKQAIESIKNTILKKESTVFLLFGITGSGKTAVYIETIGICLKQQKSIVILAPEIALAHKLKKDVSKAFPEAQCYLVHGYQSSHQKELTFRKIADAKKPLIIVGTRSALFLPINNLGAIVIDEEHDASFKQDERLIYHAKDIAWFYAKEHKAALILGSATPDIKTFYATEQSKITTLYLPKRVGSSILPQVKLIDTKKNKTKENIFTTECVETLKETLNKDEQAIVLLNRRGYAPIMYCVQCGTTASCPYCAISLTYHKKRENLICHYCGYTTPFPSPCKSCKGILFYPIGQGTEHIEEVLSSLLPYKKILRLDSDTTKKLGETEKILSAFANNEAQVLIGTQMLSKGHHFPNVTLVVVVNGDLGLNIPDYRATEKTFQLLTQAAGRAGRGNKSGKVLIQTCDTSHYCWNFIKEHDYKGFYVHEIALRKKWQYPPFTHLALLRLSYPVTWSKGLLWLEKVQSSISIYENKPHITIRGPAPAPISIIKNKKRFQWLIKGDNWQYIRSVFSQIQKLNLPKHVKVSLDIDPIDML